MSFHNINNKDSNYTIEAGVGGGGLNSLDIIEECLDGIYNIRKNNILNKSAYYLRKLSSYSNKTDEHTLSILQRKEDNHNDYNNNNIGRSSLKLEDDVYDNDEEENEDNMNNKNKNNYSLQKSTLKLKISTSSSSPAATVAAAAGMGRSYAVTKSTLSATTNKRTKANNTDQLTINTNNTTTATTIKKKANDKKHTTVFSSSAPNIMSATNHISNVGSGKKSVTFVPSSTSSTTISTISEEASEGGGGANQSHKNRHTGIRSTGQQALPPLRSTSTTNTTHFHNDDNVDGDDDFAYNIAGATNTISQQGSKKGGGGGLFHGNDTAQFSTLAEVQQDTTAIEVLKLFQQDILEWAASSAGVSRIGNATTREEMGDYYTDKYLCQQLDPLPASRVVTQARRDIQRQIEDFVLQATLPRTTCTSSAGQQQQITLDDMSTMVGDSTQIGSNISKNNTTGGSKYKGNKASSSYYHVNNSYSSPTKERDQEYEREIIAAAEQQEQQYGGDEKQRVKAQYEAIMLNKKRNKHTNDNDKNTSGYSNTNSTKGVVGVVGVGSGVGETETQQQQQARVVIESTVADIKQLLSSLSVVIPPPQLQQHRGL